MLFLRCSGNNLKNNYKQLSPMREREETFLILCPVVCLLYFMYFKGNRLTIGLVNIYIFFFWVNKKWVVGGN